jgi:hypothetical protein
MRIPSRRFVMCGPCWTFLGLVGREVERRREQRKRVADALRGVADALRETSCSTSSK